MKRSKVKLIKPLSGNYVDINQVRKINRLKELPVNFVRTGWINTVIR